jgi:hypothetical protein
MSNQYLGYIVCLISAVIQWEFSKFKQEESAMTEKAKLRVAFFRAQVPISLFLFDIPNAKCSVKGCIPLSRFKAGTELFEA